MLKADAASAEPPRNTPDPHRVPNAAIEQARAEVAWLEATHADSRQHSSPNALDRAVHSDRSAYRPEPKVAP